MSMAFCNLKNKRNPDDSITLINERKASYKFSGVYTTYSFHLRRQNTGKNWPVFFFFNFGKLLRWFFSCIDYKVLYTFHRVGGHLSSSPLFERLKKTETRTAIPTSTDLLFWCQEDRLCGLLNYLNETRHPHCNANLTRNSLRWRKPTRSTFDATTDWGVVFRSHPSCID